MSVTSAVARLRAHPALLPGLVGVLGAASLVYVSLSDPNEAGHYPMCPWLALTGTYCPGCGSLRMLHAFTHGQFAHGFGLNPLAAVIFAWAGVEYARWTRAAVTGRDYAMWPRYRYWPLVVAAVIVVYWVVRNLPFGAALAP